MLNTIMELYVKIVKVCELIKISDIIHDFSVLELLQPDYSYHDYLQ